MKVIIVDKVSGKCVHTQEISLGTVDGSKVSLKDYENEAWSAAVADGAVDDKVRINYEFLFAE